MWRQRRRDTRWRTSTPSTIHRSPDSQCPAPQQEQEGAELAVLAYGHCIECTTGPRKDRLRRLGHGLRRRRGVSPPSGDPTCATCSRPDPSHRAHRLPLGPCAPRSARGTEQVRDRDRSRICAIDEVRDRVRIMGGLPKIRTPGAQTGRCARRRATITACPVGWDRRPTRSQRNIVDRSGERSQRSARSLVAFVSRCQRLAIRQTASGRTTLAPNSCGHTGSGPHRPR